MIFEGREFIVQRLGKRSAQGLPMNGRGFADACALAAPSASTKFLANLNVLGTLPQLGN